MSIDFERFIETEQKKINEKIHSFYRNTIQAEEESSLRKFLKYSEKFVLQGGRRLHPIVLIQTFMGLAPEKQIIDFQDTIPDVSIAIELLHISSLILDDLVDRDEFRRGKKTFHRFIADQEERPGKHLAAYEMSSAIYGGNLTSLFGARIIKESTFPDDLKANALSVYLTGLAGVTRGHLLDEYYKYQVDLKKITLENYLILADKRAKQMETAVALGCIFGNARKSQIRPLKQAMNRIGIIEQMQNDYLGSFGNPDLRSIDSDIKRGQATILNVLAYQQGNDQQKSILTEILGKKDASTDEVNKIREIYQDTGAVNFIKMYANSLKNDVYNLLNSVYPGLRKSVMNFYLELLNYVTTFDS